ncbi:MAG TPA: alpha/beta fold hydrolase [Solirubrobacteraceae bacterium]|jgi:pimeloyl-ACP methyl ester carboxylesterase|nr:alpha/beta fold hydrolase [Solirubrobacteraceae bacterium]
MTVRERDLLVCGRRVHYLDSGTPRQASMCGVAGVDDMGGVGFEDTRGAGIGDAGGAGERASDSRGGPPRCAPPFVLLHGLGGCSQHWLAVLPALAERGRAIALDLPGFGASEPAAGPVSLDGLADVVAEVVALLELGPVVLVGHSFAGPLVLRCAARHPNLVVGVVPVGGAVFQFSALLGLRGVPRFLRARPRETLAILAEVLGAGMPLPTAVRRALAGSAWLRRLVLWPYVCEPAALSVASATLLLAGAGARGVFATVRAIAGSDPLDGIDAVRCPILSLASAHDLIVPLADTQELQRAVPRARTFVFEGCGHMAMLERPHAFAEQLLAFAGEPTISDPATRTGARP